MTSFPTLRALADRASYFTALRQDALGQAAEDLGEHRWDVDLATGTFAFSSTTDSTRRFVCGAHFIASIAPGPRSVLWGWAHPAGGGDRGVAAQLRGYGQAHGIAELTSPEVPFPADAPGDADWIAQVSHEIAGAAIDITGRSAYYSAPSGESGTRAVLVLDAPLPALTVAEAMIRMPRIMSTTTPADPRGAVWNLARLAGWTMTWTDDAFSGAVVTDSSGSVTFGFDEQARVTSMKASLGGTA